MNATTRITLIAHLRTTTMFDFPFDIEQDFSGVEGDGAGVILIRYNDQYVDLGLVNIAGRASTRSESTCKRGPLASLSLFPIPMSLSTSPFPRPSAGPFPKHGPMTASGSDCNRTTNPPWVFPLPNRRTFGSTRTNHSYALVTGSVLDSGHLMGAYEYTTTNGVDRVMKALHQSIEVRRCRPTDRLLLDLYV